MIHTEATPARQRAGKREHHAERQRCDSSVKPTTPNIAKNEEMPWIVSAWKPPSLST